MQTLDWTDKLDDLIYKAFRAGRTTGKVLGVPDNYIESGLAHIFFYGDDVYKMYKTHSEMDHFIKGVLAPTIRRKEFIEQDFKLNKHFAGGVYRDIHSVYLVDGVAQVGPYDGSSIHVLFEMDRLDFTSNFHEQLLSGKVIEGDLYKLGHETARLVDSCDIKVPDGLCWYDLACERMEFLRQFINWLPDDYKVEVLESGCLEALDEYLEKNKEEYKNTCSNKLSVNLDNHDENVFFQDGKPRFIDLQPPMSCWWYGVPHANLCNIMVNVEALHSEESAKIVKRGYLDYHKIDFVSDYDLAFAKAFSYLISIAHFGSLPDKADVTKKYLNKCKDIPGWFS